MSALLLALHLPVVPPADEPPLLEGETIASVSIEAPPEDVRRLEQYLEMRAGEPFRASRVRHAVELFHSTGDYEDVRVEARRGPGGGAQPAGRAAMPCQIRAREIRNISR